MKNIGISVIVDIFDDDGTTVRPKRIAKILKDKFNISFITRSDENIETLDGLKVHIVKPAKTKLWNLKLISKLYKNEFDYIYCSNDWFGFFTYYLLSKIYHYKIIFEAHSIVSKELKIRQVSKFKLLFYQILESIVIRQADSIIALSENTYEYYKQFNDHIELIPVFIDEKLFISNNKQNPSNNKKIIGLIGPFDNFGNEYFLEYLYDNIKNFDERIKFLLIGKCENKIENSRISYTNYINELEDYIKILYRG